MATATDVVTKAMSQVGQHETPIGSNRQKFGEWYGLNGYSWCDMFVSWVAQQVGAAKIIGKFAYTPSHVNWFKTQGVWHPGAAGIKLGDIVFFNFDSDVGPEHVGIVRGAPTSGGVPTVEGNTSPTTGGSQANGDGVYAKLRAPSLILGYGRPAYEKPLPPPEPDVFRIEAVKIVTDRVKGKEAAAARLKALRAKGFIAHKEKLD